MNDKSLIELKINHIDCYGLDEPDQRDIRRIGVRGWIRSKRVEAPKKGTPRACVICKGEFEARRSDARYCSGKCRMQSVRTSENVTDKIA